MVNAGFFVFSRKIFSYLSGDDCILEREPLQQLAAEGQLMAFRHDGFSSPWTRIASISTSTLFGQRGKLLGRFGMNPKYWSDRSVFVTGATGLVGSWLVRRLVESGADVVCLVRDWVPQSNWSALELSNR